MNTAAATNPSHHHRRRRPSGEPPPLPRQLNRVAIGWMVALVFFGVLWVWIFLSDRPAIWITKRDMSLMDLIVDNRTGWLDPIMTATNHFGTHWATIIVAWGTLIGALLAKRIRHALLLIASLSTVATVVTIVAGQIGRPRPFGINIIGEWEGFAQPSRPVALLAAALVAAGLSLFPQSKRNGWFWGSGVVLVIFGFAQVYTGVDHPTDVFAGATAGVALTMALYRTVAPEAVFPISYGTGRTAHLDISGPRGRAIERGLREQLGIEPSVVQAVGLESSAGSTPLRIETATGQIYFGKLYARSHLRSDRSYKLGRTLLYGQLEDEKSFSSVRRLIQHEDYILHVMRRVGLPCAEPHGIVEITPEREYLLVTEFLGDAVEISRATVTDDLIDDALEQVHVLWRSGLAHRDIKPANVMVQDGHVRLVDVSFAQIRPSPWRQAVDLANMMLVLALGSSAERVYERAQNLFTDDEIAEAFAASRGVTLPSQLRGDVRDQGRDLLAEFRALAPTRRPVVIQRWTFRRAGLILWVGLISVSVIAIFLSGLTDIGMR